MQNKGPPKDNEELHTLPKIVKINIDHSVSAISINFHRVVNKSPNV